MAFKFPKISVYDRYIFRQVAVAALVITLLFTVVWIAPETLLNTIKETLSGDYGVKTAILYLLYELPKILNNAFPVALMLGSLYIFDKMSKDSEITIFRAVGMSFPRIIAPVIVLSCIFTALCFITGDRAVPLAEAKSRAIGGQVRSTQYIYATKDEKGHPLKAVIVSKTYDRKLKDVVVLDFSSQVYQDVHQLSNIYSAKEGYVYNDRWELKNVLNYKISNDGIYFDIRHLDKYVALEGENAKDAYSLLTYSTMKERDLTNKDLYNYAKLLKKEKIWDDYNVIMNKFLQRFTHPLMCILFVILGCLLGFSKPREQRLIGFTIAIGFIFFYFITLPFMDYLAEKQVMSPYLTSTFYIIVFSIAIYFFYKIKEL